MSVEHLWVVTDRKNRNIPVPFCPS